MDQTPRLLVKLRTQAISNALAASTRLRPLFQVQCSRLVLAWRVNRRRSSSRTWRISAPFRGMPLDGETIGRSGIAASDVLFAEPDLPQSYPDVNEANGRKGAARSG